MKELDDGEFWALILAKYSVLKRGGIPPDAADPLVKIADLRRACRGGLGRYYVRGFDAQLARLLDSSRYRQAIRVTFAHPAALRILRLLPAFKYGRAGLRRNYYFISLRPENVT